MICKFPHFRLDPDLLSGRDLARFNRKYGKSAVVVKSNDLPSFFPRELIQQVRCGCCIACRVARQKDWSIRCTHEASLHDHNYFVTLTYDDAFLPRGKYWDPQLQKPLSSSLRPRDLQLFMKRLRTKLKRDLNYSGCRFFACGEYGSLGSRPHYHLCLFNMPDLSALNDLEFLKKNGSFTYYNSKLISKCWSVPGHDVSLGFNYVSEFSFDTAAYIAKYTLKQFKGKHDIPDGYLPRVEPFMRCSTRPGIGKDYIESDTVFDVYKRDTVYYTKNFKAFKARPPRYYDKLFDYLNGGVVHRWKDEHDKLHTTVEHSPAFLTLSSQRFRVRGITLDTLLNTQNVDQYAYDQSTLIEEKNKLHRSL